MVMSTDDYKKRLLGAINRYGQKAYGLNENGSIKKRRKNLSPEKDIEIQVTSWMLANGWDFSVVDARGKYNPTTRRYLAGPVERGFPDIVANSPQGVACFVELKAPGCAVRSRVSPDQYSFLTRKIVSNCFAVVVDSASILQKYWQEFQTSSDPKQYLLDLLPSQKGKASGSSDLVIFEEDEVG